MGLAIGLMLGAPAAQAYQPPATPAGAATTVEPLTVTAPKRQAAQLPSLVSRFVQQHGAPSRIDQLSRWAVPLCPKTGGLTAPFNAFVSARVLQVAKTVGVPAAKPRNRDVACKTNLLIVFTTKPQTLLDNVRKSHPQMLGFHYAAQTQRLATFDQPIQAWYMTGAGGRESLPEPDTEFGRAPQGTAGSRLSAGLTNQFMGVLVVIDSNQILGRQIGALADQIAMLSLARATRATGCSELPTILDAMNPDCQSSAPLTEMTVYDVAYLKGLYSIDPEEFLAAQRSEIGSRMLRDLTAPASPQQTTSPQTASPPKP
jgi:hypothetical protein